MCITWTKSNTTKNWRNKAENNCSPFFQILVFISFAVVAGLSIAKTFRIDAALKKLDNLVVSVDTNIKKTQALSSSLKQMHADLQRMRQEMNRSASEIKKLKNIQASQSSVIVGLTKEKNALSDRLAAAEAEIKDLKQPSGLQ